MKGARDAFADVLHCQHSTHYDIYVLNLLLTPVMHIFENCFEKPISDAELRE